MTTYSDDAIFHYTNLDGLYGILTNKEIWSTAYFTTNDVSELAAVEGILTDLFNESTKQLVSTKHEYVDLFRKHGINIFEYPREFEKIWFDTMEETIEFYITCFCKANSELEFQNGLLSQWRGYGGTSGYALQFSRSKLTDWTTRTLLNKENHKYIFHDVYYSLDNPFKEIVLDYKDFYQETYMNYLDNVAVWLQKLEKGDEPIDSDFKFILPDTFTGPLIALLLYRSQTKTSYFSEERECRMGMFSFGPFDDVEFFNKNGVLVPYIKTPQLSEPFIDCIEGIIVGPGVNQDVRYQGVSRLLKSLKLEIDVRLSKIPYTDS